MMYSFYGGKQGRTYNIVERFDYVWIPVKTAIKKDFPGGLKRGDVVYNNQNFYEIIVEAVPEEQLQTIDETWLKNTEHAFEVKGMVNEFQKGGAYSDVNYGEYVIIDTILTRDHRSDDTNGLLYRRGFDYNQSTPEEGIPKREDFWKDVSTEGQPVQKQFDYDAWSIAWKNYVLNPGGGAIYVGQIVGPKGDSPQLQGKKWQDIINDANPILGGIVNPISDSVGWDANQTVEQSTGKYRDNIRFAWANIQDADGDITGCQIAFDIPKTVWKISAQSVSPYAIDDNGHLESLSFYDEASEETNSYQPKGTYDKDTKQWKYENLIHQHSYTGIDGANEQHPFYYNYDIAIPKGIHGQDIEEIKVEKAENFDEGVTVYSRTGEEKQEYNADDLYFTYSSRNYNETENGELTEHQGRWSYRVINTITGINGERTSFDSWGPREVKVGDLFKINTTQEDNTSLGDNYYAICIKDGQIRSGDTEPRWNPEGSKTYIQVGYETPYPEENGSIWRIIQLTNTVAIRGFNIDYTAQQNDIINNGVRLLDYLFIDNEGKIYASYSDGQRQYLATIHAIDEIYYNNEDEITKEQRIQVRYKDGQIQNVSKPINRILAMRKVGDTIAVLYSDPNYRDAVLNDSSKKENIDYYRLPFEDKDEQGNPKTYSNLIWHNFGTIGSSFHIFGDYSPAEFTDAIQQDWDDSQYVETSLQKGIPKAFPEKAGWLISITDSNGKLSLYAYDYVNQNHSYDGHTTGWYKIQEFGDSLTNPLYHVRLSTKENDNAYYQDDNKLQINGLWFEITFGKDEVGS